MDINSLLSPQDTPTASPSPRSSPATIRRTKSQSTVPNARTTPLSQNHAPGTSNFPRPSPLRSPPMNHLTLNQTKPSSNTSSAMGSPQLSRQSATPGMDTLADLASMQHHQRTARTHSVGMKYQENMDKQIPSGVRPSLQAIARTHSGSRSSLDIHMAEAPAQTPEPRRFVSSSLSEENLHLVEQLTSYLASNPSAYDSHLQLIKILHHGLIAHVYPTEQSPNENDPLTYDLLPELRQAREAMSSRFTMGEEVWLDRMADEKLLARTLEDCLLIVETFEKAVSDEAGSTRLWSMYGEWMISLYNAANPDQAIEELSEPLNRWMQLTENDCQIAAGVFDKSQIIDIWKRGAEDTKYNLSDSHLIWNKYTDLVESDLRLSLSKEGIEALKRHYIERLETPHSTWDETSSRFSNFISNYDPSSYEDIMVEMTARAAPAKELFAARQISELQLVRAIDDGDINTTWKVLNEYLEWEISIPRKKRLFSYNLANSLYQRAHLLFPSVTNLWEDHFVFLGEESEYRHERIDPLPLLGRACGHCPWSGNLWSLYIQAAEGSELLFADIGQIKHKATSTGLLDSASMEDILKIHIAWSSFLRRRAFQQDSTDEDADVAEVGIRSAIEDIESLGRSKEGKDYKGDPHYRLERIYIKFLTQGQKWDFARQEWKKLATRYGHTHQFWLRYYFWEMMTWANLSGSKSIPREATKVLQQALKRVQQLDWPEKLIDIYLVHCDDHEEPSEIEAALILKHKLMKEINKRREKEAAEYAAQQQAQEGSAVSNTTSTKRKRDIEDEEDKEIKKTKSEPQEPEPKSQPPKRDRENSTVIVKNLPMNTQENWVRHFFRDCGTVKSLVLSPDEENNSIDAIIEFESNEDALSALTKDQKLFEDNVIEVQHGTSSTLYVTNFPPHADESYIREIFDRYGEIIDIRFPSLKYNTHRRFCYVQFKSSSQAVAATELDGTILEGEFTLLAKMSDPTQKNRRQGALYEGREVYVANVDWNATEEDLEKIFSKYGKVERVRIPRNKAGKSKGTAFVVFAEKVFEPNSTFYIITN
jgi:squamous cell carcinoma antigen recognized by T-cells 3